MNALLFAAGIWCAITWALHTFAGGRSIAKPLLAAGDLKDTPKYTQFYCWHIVTILLAAMAGGLVYAAFVPGSEDLALLLSVLAFALGAWGLVLPKAVGQSFSQMPQGFLLLPIGLLGLAGLAL